MFYRVKIFPPKTKGETAASNFDAKNTITANSSVCHLLWVAEKENLVPMQTNLETSIKKGGSDNYSASSLPQLQWGRWLCLSGALFQNTNESKPSVKHWKPLQNLGWPAQARVYLLLASCTAASKTKSPPGIASPCFKGVANTENCLL